MNKQEKEPKQVYSKSEIATEVTVLVIIFLVVTVLLLQPMNTFAPYWFSTYLGVVAVLGSAVLGVIILRLCPLKSKKARAFLIHLVLTLSASALVCWLILNRLSNIW